MSMATGQGGAANSASNGSEPAVEKRLREPSPMSELRRFRRVPVDLRIFTRSAQERFADDAIDLSEGGFSVASDTPLPIGARYVFSFELPHHKQPVELAGQVVWSKSTAFGVRFDRVDTRVAQYVERLRRNAESL